MQIRSMNATFGKLEQAELRLQPGLNVIYAPNESGKSTWCRFIRNMFYGLSTRDRGAGADKNRYAPWSGTAMRGRMDLTADGENYTLTRETRRAAPMGDFSCVFSDTATPVPGLTGQNAGDTLLGVSREVFERSAFIGQAALAVDQDAELERRIAALITTGEEETSYSEAYERLKKQLNRRRYNKTGQIPALEREIEGLDGDLVHLEELQRQHALTARQLEQTGQQLKELQEQQRLWELQEQREKWSQYREAEQTAAQARQRADTMAELAGTLPDGTLLSRLEAQDAALSADRLEAERARREAETAAEAARRANEAVAQLADKLPEDAVLARLEARSVTLSADLLEAEGARREAGAAAEAALRADEAYRVQSLYPADEQGLRDRLDRMVAPALPPAWPFPVCLILGLCALAAAAACLVLASPPAAWITAAIAGAGGLALAVFFKKKQLGAAAERESVLANRRELERQTEEYLPLRQAALDAADEARRAADLADSLGRRFTDGAADLIRELSPYRAAADLSAADAAIADLRRQSDALTAARSEARAADDEARRTAGLADTLGRRFADGAADLIRELSPYRVAADLSAAGAAIGELRRQSNALTAAEQAARDAEMRRDLLRQHLPKEQPGRAPEAAPSMSRSQVLAALPQTTSHFQAAQSRLDTLTGQIRSMGDPDDLITRRRQKREELEQLQGEYNAIALAMETLESANLTLQNRFSPALGARAAEIFSAVTGGKYSKVLLSRDFSLSAEPSDDPTARSIQLLSQGAADQLYLSVRLAICDMVLPREKAVPLILDDALVSFDNDRLHAALDYLLQESVNRQILLFTCQRREQEYLAGRENVALLTL